MWTKRSRRSRHEGRGLGRDAPAAASRSARPCHARRAGLHRPPAVRRASSGRARRRAGRSRGRAPESSAAPCGARDDGGRARPVARAALVNGEPASPASASSCFSRFNRCSRSRPRHDEALVSCDDVSLEWKLDGARIQVHKSGDEVRVFSRNLRDVTAAVPEGRRRDARARGARSDRRRRGHRAPQPTAPRSRSR